MKAKVRKGKPPHLDITTHASLLFRAAGPGAVIELRVLGTRRGTLSGYFDNPEDLIEAVKSVDGRGPAVYVTLNPVLPALLARANNRCVQYARTTTKDEEVVARRWLLIDADPKRPSGIMATRAERRRAHRLALKIRKWLHGRGWPEPLVADSGNGGHLVYRIDLPNDQVATELITRCLQALDAIFSDESAEVDVTVSNAARISKLYGTLVAKGDETEDRLYRRSRICRVPDKLKEVPREQLESLARLAPKPERPEQRNKARSNPSTNGVDVGAWLAEHNVAVVKSGPWRNGRRWVLERCPFNPEHTNRSAYVLQFPNGAVAAGCHHNSCQGLGWRDLRRLLEGDASAGGQTTGTPILRRIADVPKEDVKFLLFPYLPLGRCTILEGDPGLGKTHIALDFAAKTSRGKWDPFERGLAEPRDVIYMTAEDGPGDTLRPRLERAGADLTRVHVLEGKRVEGEKKCITLQDIAELDQALRDRKPALVIVDPLQAYLGRDIDAHRANETRPVLSALADLAAHHGCAVLLIRHLSKAPQAKAIYRGQGSIDITAAARSVLFVGQEPTTKQRAMVHIKHNLTPPGSSWEFKITDDGFEWGGESDLTAADLNAPEKSKKGAPRKTAIAFLREFLANGHRAQRDVIEAAKCKGITESTLRRAADDIGVEKWKVGGPGDLIQEWYWGLPRDTTPGDDGDAAA